MQWLRLSAEPDLSHLVPYCVRDEERMCLSTCLMGLNGVGLKPILVMELYKGSMVFKPGSFPKQRGTVVACLSFLQTK